MKTTLSVRNLEHRRNDRFALTIDRIDFKAGGIYCLTGPNGAGKSTLLHLLSLLSPPEGGDIRVDGESSRGARQRRRLRQRITLVEQSPFLFDATVYQNIAFGLRLRDIRGDLQRRRILKALQAVGLCGFESRQARELSGGEAQRVALARAVVLKPRILLLDEPTDCLDRKALDLFEGCLIDLVRDGATVVLATHDTLIADRLGAEVLRFEGGRLLPEESTEHQIMDIAMETA